MNDNNKLYDNLVLKYNLRNLPADFFPKVPVEHGFFKNGMFGTDILKKRIEMAPDLSGGYTSRRRYLTDKILDSLSESFSDKLILSGFTGPDITGFTKQDIDKLYSHLDQILNVEIYSFEKNALSKVARIPISKVSDMQVIGVFDYVPGLMIDDYDGNQVDKSGIVDLKIFREALGTKVRYDVVRKALPVEFKNPTIMPYTD